MPVTTHFYASHAVPACSGLSKYDNPTIGLLICKDKDNIEAQYSLEAYNLPLGISQYELSKLIPKEIKSSLPSIEQIESTLEHLSENSED